MTAFWVEARAEEYTYRILVIAGRVAVCTYSADERAKPWKIIGERWPDVAAEARDRGHTWKILE